MEGTTEIESKLKIWMTENEHCQNSRQPDGPQNKHCLEQPTPPPLQFTVHSSMYPPVPSSQCI